MSSNLSRRVFIRNSAVGASALALGATRTVRGFDANEKVRLAWIGVGGRGGQIMGELVNGCSNAVVAAVCDLKPARISVGQKVAERDKPKGYTDFREMLDKEKPDGIVVATEPCNHAALVVPVLEAGFHCFAEKPMDTTVEKVDAITKAARKAKCIYQIGTQRRYHPAYISAMELVQSGKLGKVTFMQGCWHWPWRAEDRHKSRDGSSLIEQAVHHMDVMTWAMGDKAPVSCSAMGYSQKPHPEGPNVFGETHSATSFQFPDGQIFSYTHLFCLPPKFQEEKTWIFCEDGAVDPHHGMMYPTDANKKEESIGIDSKEDWGLGTKDELCDFAENIRTGGKRVPNANVETGRVATLMAIIGTMATINSKKNVYEPQVLKWEDTGSTT